VFVFNSYMHTFVYVSGKPHGKPNVYMYIQAAALPPHFYQSIIGPGHGVWSTRVAVGHGSDPIITAVPPLGQGNDPISGQQDTSQTHKCIASGASSEILKSEILRSEANSMPPGVGVGLGVGVRPGGRGSRASAGAKSVRGCASVDMNLRQLQVQLFLCLLM
jgi:hypothetical protein